MKKLFTSILLVAMVVTLYPSITEAQVNYQTYTPRSQEETIAYLHGVIARLLAELQARGQVYTVNYSGSGGQVLGSTYSGPTQRVDVGTGFVRFDGNDVTFDGTIDLERADYANVWFEYSEDDDDFDERTEKRRMTRDGSFKIEADNLRRGEIYHYRAVAESPSGHRSHGVTRFFFVSGGSSRSGSDDEPDVSTDRATDIEERSAELNGEVDMNDFRNGVVFFVYGEDEDQIADVDRDYDSYNDVDEDGDDLQKVRVDSDLDGQEDYTRRVTGLDDNTDYYFQICVEYEDEDDDEVLECGGVEDFETDDNGGSSGSREDEPEANTLRADDVEDDRADLRGEVDMNDFENGRVFFVYGEDESQVEDIENDYDTYNEIDEDGDDLQKVLVDSDLDGFRTYWRTVVSLDDNTDHYYQICVEYEDEDNNDVIECGGVENFETD